VGDPYWFVTSRGTDDDEIEAPFEYVTAVREPDIRIMREYVLFWGVGAMRWKYYIAWNGAPMTKQAYKCDTI